jgi:hypothetical protein
VLYSYLSLTHGASWYVRLCRRWLPGWHERRIGSIRLFENPHVVPRVFVSTVPRDARSTMPLLTLPLSHRSALELPSRSLRVRVESQSATGVELTVPRLKHSMMLVLANDFSPLWHISVQPRAASRLPASVPEGIAGSPQLADGYGMGWVLPAGPGYRVTLSYYPQQVMDQGAIVSVLALLACIGLAVTTHLWRARRVRAAISVSAVEAQTVQPTEVA